MRLRGIVVFDLDVNFWGSGRKVGFLGLEIFGL